MPGKLTIWQINEDNMTPVIFPVFTFMSFHSYFVAKNFRKPRNQGNAHVALSVGGILFFLNTITTLAILDGLHDLITNPFGSIGIKHTFGSLTPAHTSFT